MYALGKKHYDDPLDPYFLNIGQKIKYLNTILEVFGFKSLLNQNIIVELDDTLRKKMENSKLLDKTNYSTMIKIFNKPEQSKNINGKFEIKNFIKLCNCILNEFGFKIDSNKKQFKINKIHKWIIQYKLNINMIDIINIIDKN